jgi:thiol-disulfide isomerase/thioredoxin
MEGEMTVARLTLGLVLLASAGATRALAAVSPAPPAASAPSPDDVSALTVFVDLIVEDARGRPAANLQPEEVVLVQDGVRQKIATLVAKPTPGHYELTYVPAFGKAGAIKLQVLRPGARARGADGTTLKPRVVRPLSPLESELQALLDSRPDGDGFPLHARVLSFAATPEGLQHVFAVEVRVVDLVHDDADLALPAHVQAFVRLKDDEGRVLQRFYLDETIGDAARGRSLGQGLVWTPSVPLRPGRYTVETLARDVATSRVATRQLDFTAFERPAGLRVSSVSFVGTTGVVVRGNRRGAVTPLESADDPLYVKDTPILPTLDLRTSPSGAIKFFATVYPDAASSEAVALRLDLLRDGNIVASSPLVAPPSEKNGEIRYVGGISAKGLKPGLGYALRVQAQQGTTAAFEEAPFTVETSEVAPIRLGQGAPTGAATASASTPRRRPPSDLEEARLLIRRQLYPEAIANLTRLERTTGGGRADLSLLLAVAYYRTGAHKDGEAAARRALELGKDDPATVTDAYILLGRSLAEGEKKAIRADSERLAAAEDAFRHAIESSGGRSTTAQIALLENLLRQGRGDDAQRGLTALLEKPEIEEATAARARQLLQSPRCATEPCLPELSFVTSDGHYATPEDLKGKVVLLSFWASWCKPCMAAVPDLKRLHAHYEKEPFVMVGVNWDHDADAMKTCLETNGIRWAQINDGSDRLGDQLGVRGIPSEILFDHEGVAIGRTTGWGQSSMRDWAGRIDVAIGKAKKAASSAASSPSR